MARCCTLKFPLVQVRVWFLQSVFGLNLLPSGWDGAGVILNVTFVLVSAYC